MEDKKDFLLLDSSVPHYAELIGYAGRIDALLSIPALQADEGVISSLDFLVGAIHALLLAGHFGFRERKGRTPQTAPIRELAIHLSNGRLRNDGAWLAGFHLNNALARLAAVYERVLKIAAGRRQQKDKQKSVLDDALARYKTWKPGTEWAYANIDSIYNEVNTLKHDPSGLYRGRNVELTEAVRATDEVLELLEAWNEAGRP